MEKFIKEGDVETIQMNMIIEFESVNTSAYLHAMMKEVEKRVPDLWQPYEEKAFARAIDSNENSWNKDYAGTQQVYLQTNFSKKRFSHLIEVREYLK